MRKNRTIGVLTPVLDGFYFGNILWSITQKAREYDAKVVVIGTAARNWEYAYAVDYVDGWIVIMDAVNQDYVSMLRERGKPVIGINTHLEVDYRISCTNEAMMDTAVEHLHSHGHTRIAFVGDHFFNDAAERYAGYLKAMDRLQLGTRQDWFFNTRMMSTYEIVSNMVANKLPCSAIITVNDLIAIELIHHCKTLGVRIPEDIAIIGVDDVPMAHSIRPSLSTFHIQVNEIGSQAAEMLLQIVGGNKPQGHTVRVGATPKFRRSCGCPKVIQTEEELDSADTNQYLVNMVARNFNLGFIMQAYKYEQIMEMTWLHHTPFRRGLVGLRDEGDERLLHNYKYHIGDEGRIIEEKQHLPSTESGQFPNYDALHDESFMLGENVMVVIAFGLDNSRRLGVLGFVGLGDISTSLYPINTTFQLGNFLASALVRESINRELETYSRQLEIISNITHDGIWEYDTVSRKVVVRGGIYRILGYGPDNTPKSIEEMIAILHPEDFRRLEQHFNLYRKDTKPFETECRLRDAAGQYVWMQVTGQTQHDSLGNLTRMLGSIKNISERKQSEERIRQLAYTDTLTGLSNRHHFEQQLSELIEESKNKGSKAALILFDLDRFKMINDTYGHQAGDRVLQYVASKVQSIVPSKALVARLGGDEFVIALPELQRPEEALALGDEINRCWIEPFHDDEREYYLSSSIGISFYPEHGYDTQTIMKHADIAMYNAKANGRNQQQVFMSDPSRASANRLNMENHLRKALERRELVVHYQPQYDVKDGRIYGVEALVRWNSPQFGFVRPLDFIPLAEESGLIIPIGEWVLREACYLNRRCRDKGLPALKVSVNISAKQLSHAGFVNQVRSVLEETGADPRDLCLEITESVMLQDIDHSLQVLKELLQFGLYISMDDFGTGYSSLSLLKDLPIGILKIDKSFINDMTANPQNSAIVHAIINMSHIMSMKVVAEGVETREQQELLQALQVDYLQGYLISRPVPIELLEQLLTKPN